MKRRLVLLGPPASGKGTQAAKIQATYGIPATSTGAILRREKDAGTEIGLRADEFTRHGQLVPDDMIFRLVEGWLATHDGSFLFDGFPRTVRQAELLDAFLAAREAAVEQVVLLDLPEPVIRERVSNRVVCSVCGAPAQIGRHVSSLADACPACGGALKKRRDDTEEVLEQRMAEYREHTAPLIPYYETRSLLGRVDAGKEGGIVFREICRLLEDPA